MYISLSYDKNFISDISLKSHCRRPAHAQKFNTLDSVSNYIRRCAWPILTVYIYIICMSAYNIKEIILHQKFHLRYCVRVALPSPNTRSDADVCVGEGAWESSVRSLCHPGGWVRGCVRIRVGFCSSNELVSVWNRYRLLLCNMAAPIVKK